MLRGTLLYELGLFAASTIQASRVTQQKELLRLA